MAGSTNNKKKDYPPRTFVKEQKDGPPLTRTVTTPATEVAATYDGFTEQPAVKASGGSSGGGSNTGKQASSAS